MEQISNNLNSKQKKDIEIIENAIDRFCETTDNDMEIRLCYYIVTRKRDISIPIRDGLPLNKLCERLASGDDEVCRLKYRKFNISTIFKS